LLPFGILLPLKFKNSYVSFLFKNIYSKKKKFDFLEKFKEEIKDFKETIEKDEVAKKVKKLFCVISASIFISNKYEWLKNSTS
jgi:DNA-binding Lrp family transcriptional regulator